MGSGILLCVKSVCCDRWDWHDPLNKHDWRMVESAPPAAKAVADG